MNARVWLDSDEILGCLGGWVDGCLNKMVENGVWWVFLLGQVVGCVRGVGDEATVMIWYGVVLGVEMKCFIISCPTGWERD